MASSEKPREKNSNSSTKALATELLETVWLRDGEMCGFQYLDQWLQHPARSRPEGCGFKCHLELGVYS